MSEHRREILEMLSRGQITADEAERLLAALDRGGADETAVAKKRPRYLRVLVDGIDERKGGAPMKVNVRVPMQLLRAGVRLSALIPPKARDEVNAAMAREGIPFDINQLKPENLDDLIEHLGDFQVDVDSTDARVRVYCE